MRTRGHRALALLRVVVLAPLLGLAGCSNSMDPEGGDGLELRLLIIDPSDSHHPIVTSEPLIVRAEMVSEAFVSEVVYQLNDGPEEDCGGSVESILCNMDGLVEGVNTIVVIGRTENGAETADRLRVYFAPQADGSTVRATLDPGEFEFENAQETTRTVHVLFWRTPDHIALLGASASDLPPGVEAETTSCTLTEDDIARSCAITMTFPAGMLPGQYEIRIGWGNFTIVGTVSLPVQVTGAGPAGCEDLRLFLDFEPEIPSGSSDIVPVFIDRAPDVEGQVELTLIEPEGIDVFSFDPNPAPPDEDFSILQLTLVGDLPPGTVLEMGIRGAIPLLEDPGFQCTIPLRVHVIDPQG